MSPHVRSIVKDLVLTLITFGLYNLWVQKKQIEALNAMVGEERYHFWMWLLLTLVTCGLYHIYHEYRISTDIARKLEQNPGQDGLIAVILSAMGLWIVVDAIQQSQINRYYGANHV